MQEVQLLAAMNKNPHQLFIIQPGFRPAHDLDTALKIPGDHHTILKWSCISKTQYRKFETNISRTGIARPQSQFPHSCVCERFIYSNDHLDRSWEYKNRSQTQDCGNGDWGHATPFLGIHKWYFRCSAIQRCCYIRVDFATATSQNGVCVTKKCVI